MNEELANKWPNYLDEFFNCEQPFEVIFSSHNRIDQICLNPSLEKIKYKIKKFRNHKSLGEDEIVI